MRIPRFNNAGEPDGYDGEFELVQQDDIINYYQALSDLIDAVNKWIRAKGRAEQHHRNLDDDRSWEVHLMKRDIRDAKEHLEDASRAVLLTPIGCNDVDQLATDLQDNIRRSVYGHTVRRILRSYHDYPERAVPIWSLQELEQTFQQAQKSLLRKRQSELHQTVEEQQLEEVRQYYDRLLRLLNKSKEQPLNLLQPLIDEVNSSLAQLGHQPLSEAWIRHLYNARRTKYIAEVIRTERRKGARMTLILPDQLDERYKLVKLKRRSRHAEKLTKKPIKK